MQKTRDRKIIEALGKRDGQTFLDLLQSSGIEGRQSLVLGLQELERQGIIKKEPESKKWFFQEIKNKLLLDIKKKGIMNFDLEEIMQELKNYEHPFDLGLLLIRPVLITLSRITLEHHSPSLSNFERSEFARLEEYCNAVINRTFSTLESIDFVQTQKLKHALDMTINKTYPDFDLQFLKHASPRIIRKGQKIAADIIRNLP